jgi:hypothetical protein
MSSVVRNMSGMNQLSHCLHSRKCSNVNMVALINYKYHISSINSDFSVHLIAGIILYVLVLLMLVARGGL